MRTIELVEKLRRYRGRLTKRLLCRALGIRDTNKAAYLAVCKLCARFDIMTADDPGGVVTRAASPVRLKEPKARAVQVRPVGNEITLSLAKMALHREIQAAVSEAGWSKPFKPGQLEW